MKQTLTLALALGLATGGAVWATTTDEIFKTLDTDTNGAIGQAAFRALRADMFARIDADQDGVVTAGEIEAAGTSLPLGTWAQGNRIEELDAEGSANCAASTTATRVNGQAASKERLRTSTAGASTTTVNRTGTTDKTGSRTRTILITR